MLKVKWGSVVLVSPTVLPATVEDTFGSLSVEIKFNNEIQMIFIHDVYKFIPTYRLTLSGYLTRETIHQIGVA